MANHIPAESGDPSNPGDTPRSHEESPRSPGDEGLGALAIRMLDGDDSPEIRASISQRLADPAFRSHLVSHAIDQINLRQLLCEEDAQRWVAVAGGDSKSSSEPLASGAAPVTRKSRGTFPHSTAEAWWRGAVAIAATLLLAVVGSQWMGMPENQVASRPSIPVCRVVASDGDVYLGGRLVAAGTEITDGQQIRVEGALSSVKMAFADDTELQFAGDARVTFQRSGQVNDLFLEYGNAVGRVGAEDSDTKIMLHTPAGRVGVDNSDFTLAATGEKTEVTVTRGTASVTRRRYHKPIDVGRGESVEIRLTRILPAIDSVDSPEQWRESFDQGLPRDWKSGVWEPSGAVAAAPTGKNAFPTNAEDQPQPEIAVVSNSAWAQGLTRVEEDTWLTYRVKMDRPQWYGVFLTVRGGAVEDGRWSWNYEFVEHVGSRDHPWKEVEPGAWRTIRVPLSEFKRTPHQGEEVSLPYIRREDSPPPPVGGVVVTAIFTSPEADRGLVIDDLAIGPRHLIIPEGSGL